MEMCAPYIEAPKAAQIELPARTLASRQRAGNEWTTSRQTHKNAFAYHEDVSVMTSYKHKRSVRAA